MVYDVAVVGLGGMGSAALYHLARRGARVIGFDRFSPPHAFGSSHGHSRIIRQAYFEGPGYVPLLLRAYELWEALEQDVGQRLLVRCGGLMIGRPDAEVVDGARRSAEEHGLAHELLEPAEVTSRFPAFRLQDDEIAVYEEIAGALYSEDAIRAHLRLAHGRGADLRTETPVLRWEPTGDGDGVAVTTADETVEAGRLVLAAGAWSEGLAGGVLQTQVERQVPMWFRPGTAPERFGPEQMPVFVTDQPAGRMYGVPDLRGEGVKVAFHHDGVIGDPDALSRAVRDEEVDAVREAAARFLRDVGGDLASAEVCFYTNSADGHFVVGPHPDASQVVLLAGFSGHGYKFCSVMGEIATALATGGDVPFDLSLFRPDRLAAA